VDDQSLSVPMTLKAGREGSNFS